MQGADLFVVSRFDVLLVIIGSCGMSGVTWNGRGGHRWLRCRGNCLRNRLVVGLRRFLPVVGVGFLDAPALHAALEEPYQHLKRKRRTLVKCRLQ